MGSYVSVRTVQAKFIRTLYFLNESNLALSTKRFNLAEKLSILDKIKIGFNTFMAEWKNDMLYQCCVCHRNRIKRNKDEIVFG